MIRLIKKYDFTNQFCELLEEDLNQLMCSVIPDYNLGEKLSSTDRIKAPVDFVIETRDRLFLIEIEMHRADPSNNIAKIAYCLNKLEKEAVVIQWFSPYYKRRDNDIDKAKKILAKYLGKKLFGEKYYPIESYMDKTSFEEFYKTSEKGQKLDTEELDKIVKDTFNKIENIFLTVNE